MHAIKIPLLFIIIKMLITRSISKFFVKHVISKPFCGVPYYGFRKEAELPDFHVSLNELPLHAKTKKRKGFSLLTPLPYFYIL